MRLRSRRRSAASPVSCTLTSTQTTRGPRNNFKEAAEAYEVLSDPERRRTYDAFGHQGLRSGGSMRAAGFGSFQDIFDTFFFGSEGRFGDLFGGGGRVLGGRPAAVTSGLRRDPARRGTDGDQPRGRVRGGDRLRALQGQRCRARHADRHLRDLRRRRAGASGLADPLRPGDEDRKLPDLLGRRQERRVPL